MPTKESTQSKWKKPLGVLCIILGLLALVTPFTPGSWLVFVGLELLGLRLFFRGRAWRDFFKK
ncbi:MAG: hypothetical protein WD003_01110 [Candidatus Paceibacterota bacterium]